MVVSVSLCSNWRRQAQLTAQDFTIEVVLVELVNSRERGGPAERRSLRSRSRIEVVNEWTDGDVDGKAHVQ